MHAPESLADIMFATTPVAVVDFVL